LRPDAAHAKFRTALAVLPDGGWTPAVRGLELDVRTSNVAAPFLGAVAPLAVDGAKKET